MVNIEAGKDVRDRVDDKTELPPPPPPPPPLPWNVTVELIE